jgi:hypothetical protein
MLGSGMKSFAGSVPLQRNRRMRGSRHGLNTRLGNAMRLSSTVIAATAMTTAIGIAANRLA